MSSARWQPTLKRVLCALDVEQPTLSALTLANLIATRFEAKLEALYVGKAAGAATFGGPLSSAERVGELMDSHNSEQQLEEIVRSLGHAIPATTRFVLGSPAPAILERAEKQGCDLIVLGARQRSDLGWQFRDDVARDVAALASCATLTVHERDVPDSIERILVPIDFGTVTSSALGWAALFAARFRAQVQLLHVVSRERSTTRGVNIEKNVVRSSNVPPDVAAELAELSTDLTRRGIDAVSEVVIASNIANGIADYNDRGEFDLVVLGMRGEPQGPARLTRGIVSTLRSRMSIPVLTLRAPPRDDSRVASGD
ncbi:MAG TPA: universal stress protein [Polyangiaceae bacterium]|nr:universal stress protein [Polyangiaceae bacterium]